MSETIQRYGFTPGFCDEPGEFEATLDGVYVLYDAHVAALAERDRLLKVFYESSSHFQNEDGGCDCADCQDVKEILGGK